MLTPQEVLRYLKAEPFRPFRIHLASGNVFDVKHPELARVGRNFLVIFTFVADSPDLLDRWETVSLMLIEHISYTEVPTNQN
ncbi:MAG: hypothetical protein SGJ19_03105 [Planctomycetia bacterium]|nr:hypothetical protein [Planctomycetia bacterium]